MTRTSTFRSCVEPSGTKVALLQEAQELDLGGGRDLPDFVEEEGPLVRRGEVPGLPLGGAGEGALLVAEELALEQRLGQRRAVHLDERAPRRGGSGSGWSRASWLLPVPLSPRSRTVASVDATWRAAASTAFIAGLSATRSGMSRPSSALAARLRAPAARRAAGRGAAARPSRTAWSGSRPPRPSWPRPRSRPCRTRS